MRKHHENLTESAKIKKNWRLRFGDREAIISLVAGETTCVSPNRVQFTC